MDVFLAGGVFLVAYALIASERFDRTLIALLGGLLVVVLGVIDQEEAFAAAARRTAKPGRLSGGAPRGGRRRTLPCEGSGA